MRHLHSTVFLSLLVLAPNVTAQESERLLPEVVQHSEPVYPPLARQARISGEVRLVFTTNGETVVSAEAETGPELLRKTAEENVKSWRFVAHDPGKFNVTFRYRLSDGAGVVFLPPRGIVEIIEPPPQMSINYAWLDLGKWKAQLQSTHGKFQRSFQIGFSGPNGDWVQGHLLNERTQAEDKIGQGYFNDAENMFVFTVTLTQPKGNPLSTSFVGKISGDRITGTFVDETGATGVWTAIRQK